MSNKKKTVTVLQIAAASMLVVGAYAAIPGAFANVPALQAAPDAGAKGAGPKKPKGIQIAMVQYGPEPQQFDPIPLGEAQSSVPAPRRLLGPSSTSPLSTYAVAEPQGQAAGGDPNIVGVSQVNPLSAGMADIDCRLDQSGHRAAIPLDGLVSLMQQGVRAYGPGATSAQIRMLIQVDLNRSGDTALIKTRAIERVASALAGDAAARDALAKPFDLNDDGMVYANGYDPCGNPAAIGGGAAFGQGPFAGDFQTINPVPVVATKLTVTAEGGSGT